VESSESVPIGVDSKGRKTLTTFLQILGSVALISVLVYLVEPGSILDALRGADIMLVLSAAGLAIPSVGLSIAVWWILLRCIEPSLPFRSAAGAVMAGYTLALVTPARVGEPGARIYYHRRLGKARLFGAFAVQGIYRTALYFVGGAIALGFAVSAGLLGADIWIPVAIAGALAGFLFVMAGLFPTGVVAMMGRISILGRVLPSLDFVSNISRGATASLFLTSTLRYLTTLTQFSLLLIATGVPAGFSTQMSGAGFVFFIKSFVPNLFFTDLGIREGAAAFFFQSLGDVAPEAVAAALGLFGINAVLPALLGIPVLLFHPEDRPDQTKSSDK
jgi:uncharacterized membrane protein YbhN (UPF0104 family)